MLKNRGSNTIILNYRYRVDPNHRKCVCDIFWIPCEFPDCIYQFDKHWLQNCAPLSQPSYDRVENIYYKNYLNVTTIRPPWNS